MTQARDEIVILMPAYNEAPYIADVVRSALKYAPVVVIDDGSTDGTAATAAMAGAKVLQHATNRGKGKALNTGFAYAVQRKVAAAITLDADGQHDPDEIPRFLEAFQAGLGDIIIGQRDFSRMPAKNQFGNRVGTFLLSLAMGRPIPDNQSGYRLLSRPVLERVRTSATRFEAEVELLLRAQLAGFRIAWIPIKTIYTAKVSHFRPLHDSWLFLKMTWRIWRARRRGRFEP